MRSTSSAPPKIETQVTTNAALWRKIRNADEQIAHLVSARIVQFAQDQGAGILVFEHLGNLKPEKGTYSRRGNADRNASLVIGHRLIVRSQTPLKEKPPAPVRRAGRVEKSAGVALSQEAQRKKGPSVSDAWHGDDNAHGTRQEGILWMDERPSAISRIHFNPRLSLLRLYCEAAYMTFVTISVPLQRRGLHRAKPGNRESCSPLACPGRDRDRSKACMANPF